MVKTSRRSSANAARMRTNPKGRGPPPNIEKMPSVSSAESSTSGTTTIPIVRLA